MSNNQEKIKDPAMIEKISNLRKEIFETIDHVNEAMTGGDKPACIAELTLAKRELQSARHWLGECLSFYDTGYRVTDNPKDPGSESQAAQ